MKASSSSYRLYLELLQNDTDLNSFPANEERQLTESKDDFDIYNKERLPSTYEWIQKEPSVSQFAQFINRNNLRFFLLGSHTLFVPLNTRHNSLEDDRAETLKLYIVDYTLLPIELINRSIKIKVRDTRHSITSINLNIYNDGLYTNNRILKAVKTSNGYIYIVEKPFKYYT